MTQEDQGIEVKPGFTIPLEELQFSYTASSGPGGQKVNKTATKVRLKWWPMESAAAQAGLSSSERTRLLKKARQRQAEDGSLQVVCDRFRTRDSNKRESGKKLAELIRGWLRKPKKRIRTAPTRASKERRLKQKKRDARVKQNRSKPKWD